MTASQSVCAAPIGAPTSLSVWEDWRPAIGQDSLARVPIGTVRTVACSQSAGAAH